MLGERLIALGALSREGLVQGLAEQDRRAARGEGIKIGDVLVEMGLVTGEQLSLALADRRQAKTA